MTCDDAFEILTQPRPIRSRDFDEHLAGCPRCRQMQEVLAPAIGLLATARAVIEPACQIGESGPDAAQRTPWTEVARIEAALMAAGQAGLAARQSAPRRAPALRSAALVLAGVAAAFVVNTALHSPAGAGNEGLICNRVLAARLKDAGGNTPRALQLAASCIACHHQEREPDLH